MAQYVGTVNKSYISSIAFMDQREILNQVLDVTSEDAGVMDIFDMTGRMVATKEPTYTHFTNDYITTAGTISAIDATNNGEAVASVNETLVVTLSVEEALPVIGELALLPNKRQGRITAVNKSTRVITISPFSNAAADTLSPAGGTVAVSDKVTFFSDAYGEGSRDPEGRRPKFIRSENQIQIFKTARKVTDLQKVSAIEVNYQGKPYIMYKMQHDCLLEHRQKIANQLLIGKKAKYTDADGNDVYQTQGLRQYIQNGDGSVLTSGGINVPLTVAVTLTNLRDIGRALDKRGAGSEYWMWNGGDFDADLDALLRTLPGVDHGIVYNSWGVGDGKQRALDLGVDSFRFNSRVYHKKLLKAYDNPEVFAPSAAFNYASESYLIPAGKMKIDASGATIDALRVRYAEGDGTSFGDMYKETRLGKLAPVPTDDEAALKISYESIMGLEATGIRQFGTFSKA